MGLFRVSPGVARPVRLLSDCGGVSVGLEGALWVLESRTTPGAREFIYKDGQLTPHLVADPVYGLAQGGFLHRPVRIGDQVYAYAVGVPGQSYPATLRLMTFDDFNSLAAEAVP